MATTRQAHRAGTAGKAKGPAKAEGKAAETARRSDKGPKAVRNRKSDASSTRHKSERRQAGKPTAKHDASATSRIASHEADRPSATFRDGSKGSTIVSLLKLKGGATITKLTKATGWQAHSVRGFLSGALKKKRGLTIASRKGGDGERRYSIAS